MQSYVAKLLLLVCLSCVICCSCVKADKKVTVNSFNVDVPSNDVIESWDSDLTDNLVQSTINLKKDCPEMMELDITVYKGNDMVNQMHQKLKKPIQDLGDYNICGMFDGPEPEDDSCSIAQGEHVAKDCDVGKLYKDLEPGDYRAECEFTQNNNVVANVLVEVKVEEA